MEGADTIAPTLVRGAVEPSMAFFHAWMGAIFGAFALVAVGMALATSISVPFGYLAAHTAVVAVLTLIAAGFCYRHARLQHGFLAIGWAGALNGIAYLPMYAAARSSAPLQDALFAKFDARLGLEAPTVLGWLQHHAIIRQATLISYQMLPPMVICALLVTAMTGPIRVIKEYVLGNTLAICLAIPVFRWLPAIGPWTVYGFTPGPNQLACTRNFAQLRGAGVYVIDPNYSSGLIAFPSFHVVMAVLSAVALWSVRRARIPAAVLCGLIVYSTVATGWHYVVDALAGIVFAALAHAGARVFTAAETRRAARQSA